MIQPGMIKLEKDNNKMMIDEGKIFSIHILYTYNIDVFKDQHFF